MTEPYLRPRGVERVPTHAREKKIEHDETRVQLHPYRALGPMYRQDRTYPSQPNYDGHGIGADSTVSLTVRLGNLTHSFELDVPKSSLLRHVGEFIASRDDDAAAFFGNTMHEDCLYYQFDPPLHMKDVSIESGKLNNLQRSARAIAWSDTVEDHFGSGLDMDDIHLWILNPNSTYCTRIKITIVLCGQ